MNKSQNIMRTLLLLFLFISINTVAQYGVPTKRDLKRAKQDTNLTVDKMISEYKNWKVISLYNYKTRKFHAKEASSQTVKIIDSSMVNYVTATDLLVVMSKTKFEIIYGGDGPEKQVFEIISFDGKYLILESKFTNEGYVDGKRVWKQKVRARYLWRLE